MKDTGRESESESDEIPVPGVRGLDHTADVGLELWAPDLPELFKRGARAAMWLVLEREPTWEGRPETRSLDLVEPDLPSLFRSWLRTLLFWQETEAFQVEQVVLRFWPVPLCTAPDGQAFGLKARVEGQVEELPAVREIKGVTLHGLALEERGGEWYGRVIFDV